MEGYPCATQAVLANDLHVHKHPFATAVISAIPPRTLLLKAHLMKALKPILLGLLLLTISTSTPGQKPDRTDGTIFAGPHISFVLKEPAGWTMIGEVSVLCTGHLCAISWRRVRCSSDSGPLKLTERSMR